MRRSADLIREERYELAALMSFEAGKNRFEALADAEESADLIRYYAQELEDANGFDRPMGSLTPNEKTRDVLRPFGVWGVIAPFNFPLALAAGMCAGALLGGNAVVYKPSPDAPSTGVRLVDILRRAGVPEDAVSFLTDSGAEVGKAMVASPGLAGLAFTGSKAVGQLIYRNFNAVRPRPCLLELGGKNPAIVTAHADLDKAAEGVMRAAFGFTGQKCSACSRVYVHRSVARDFKEQLIEKTRAIVVGDPTHRDTFMGPLINERAHQAFEAYVAEAKDAGGRLLSGGEVLRDGALARGFYVSPTIVDALPTSHRLFKEELFVPFVTVAEVGSLDEALDEANDVEYGLTAGVFSEDDDEIATFFDRIEAGVAHANRRSGATTGAWPGVNPFCGWKGSGASGKGVCGPYYVPQFMREQSQTRLV